MKRKFNLWPVLIIGTVCILIFVKFFTKGLLPIPGDLLVSFYYPWYSGGWEGYSPWTTHKASIGDDSLRQQIPWVSLGISEIKKGNIPLWNPYNFSGNPHLANNQSFIFYPLNFVFLILPLANAWSLLIFLQFFLGILFLYLFLKKIKLNTYASLLGSFAFVFSAFFVFNSEINIIGHSIIWMPLILYAYESLKEKFQLRYLILSTFAFSALSLGGNTQVAVYALILCFSYVLFMDIFQKTKISFWIFASLLAALLLTSFQIFPMLELYLKAPLGIHHPLFNKFLMPPQNLISFLAPDFFGNAATNNFFSTQYGDGTPHIGVIPLILAVFVLFNLKDTRSKFFALTAFVSLLFVLPGPLSYLVNILPIPVLSGSPPVRAIYVTSLSLAVLSAIGLDQFIKGKNLKSLFKVIALFAALYALIILYLLVNLKTGKDLNSIANIKISLRNLVIPLITFGAFTTSVVLCFKLKTQKLFLFLTLLLTILPFLYTTNKVLPFAKKEFLFPSHKVLDFLKTDSTMPRFYGIDTAYFATNFASYYGVYSPEGYGVLRLKRYAQLIAASKTGEIPQIYDRADAVFPQKENGKRKRIFDLLGVKYFLDKNDLEEKSWNPEPDRFPGDKVNLVWQDGKFKIYQRVDSMPRYFQSSSFKVLDDRQIIKEIYNLDFDQKTILLEKNPDIQIDDTKYFSVPELVNYSPNIAVFKTDANQPTLLFLSDAADDGWDAYIDGTKTAILRADYAFRSVAIPGGSHEVLFKYQPKSFSIGILISALTLLILTIFLKVQHSKGNF